VRSCAQVKCHTDKKQPFINSGSVVHKHRLSISILPTVSVGKFVNILRKTVIKPINAKRSIFYTARKKLENPYISMAPGLFDTKVPVLCRLTKVKAGCAEIMTAQTYSWGKFARDFHRFCG
jgi:hypothetical protein